MAAPRRQEPFTELLDHVRKQRIAVAQTLALGKWQSAEDARELVGMVKALDEIESEMARISGPGSHFGETDF